MSNMFICIDPGLQGTGIAVFFEDKLLPEKTTVLHSKTKSGSWIERATEIIYELETFITENVISTGWFLTKAYIELPTFFQTAKGASCASGKNGDDSDLVKLAVLVGRFYEIFSSYGIDVEFVRVNDWKGTMAKFAVIARIAKRLNQPVDSFDNHSADAIGIGLWVKGVFQPTSGSSANDNVPLVGRKQ